MVKFPYLWVKMCTWNCLNKNFPKVLKFHLLLQSLLFLFKLSSNFRVHLSSLSPADSDLFNLPTDTRQMEINNPLENPLGVSTAVCVLEDWKWVWLWSQWRNVWHLEKINLPPTFPIKPELSGLLAPCNNEFTDATFARLMSLSKDCLLQLGNLVLFCSERLSKVYFTWEKKWVLFIFRSRFVLLFCNLNLYMAFKTQYPCSSWL